MILFPAHHLILSASIFTGCRGRNRGGDIDEMKTEMSKTNFGTLLVSVFLYHVFPDCQSQNMGSLFSSISQKFEVESTFLDLLAYCMFNLFTKQTYCQYHLKAQYLVCHMIEDFCSLRVIIAYSCLQKLRPEEPSTIAPLSPGLVHRKYVLVQFDYSSSSPDDLTITKVFMSLSGNLLKVFTLTNPSTCHGKPINHTTTDMKWNYEDIVAYFQYGINSSNGIASLLQWILGCFILTIG